MRNGRSKMNLRWPGFGLHRWLIPTAMSAPATSQATEQQSQLVMRRPNLVAAQITLRVAETVHGRTELAAGQRQRLDQRSQIVEIIGGTVFVAQPVHQGSQATGREFARRVKRRCV